MRFRYVAYSLPKGVVKGSVQAEDSTQAWDNLAQQGFKVLKLKSSWQPPTLEQLFPSFFKVRAGELVRFTRQLSIMVRGGGSLQRALELLQLECSNQVLRRILVSIRRTVDEGGSLSSALGQHAAVFSPRFVSVVGAGEYTGRLSSSLGQMADILEREHEAKQRAKRTMMMPMFTIGASALMLVLMLTVLLPPLLSTFERMGANMPLVTRLAVAMVNGVRGDLTTVLGALAALVVGFLVIKKIPSLHTKMHGLQARLPIWGPIVISKELSVFSRTVGMLVEAGVSLAQALPLAIGGTKNVAIKRAFQAGEETLVSGHGLTTGFREHTVLPKMWVELVMIGEESNTLGKTMNDLAEAYQKEMEGRLGSLLALLEPVSTMTVGGVVLFMALSMFLPLYSGLNTLRP
ncbi:MAG: type II secretion system F family protein [SAR202 cluster bacterium]|nr:type II secretion system F family protein [SAR202 cluster bacterium]